MSRQTPRLRAMRFFPALLCALVVAGGAWLAAQQPPAGPDEQSQPVFRAGTELIQVDVSVLDNRRLPVRGLTAEDFTVLEDGRPRPIETFTFVDLPERVASRDAAWISDVPPDVTTNQVTEQEGRLVVIVMDRTIPVGMPTLTAREIATAAVNELGPGDLAALVSTGGGVPQNFTSDRARLLRAITQRDWSSGSSAESEEIYDNTLLAPGLFTTLTDGRCLCGLCVPETVTRVAEALRDVPRRRKSLLFIGSDFVVQAGPQTQQSELGCGQKLEDARELMFSALDRSGMTVHGIDPSGLNNIGPISQASSTLRAGGVMSAGQRAVEQRLTSQNNLHVVPDYTGGRTIANTNAPQARVPEIVRESASYYLIGFQPSDSDPTRTVRSIDVRVNRRGVTVRARRQYVVPGATATVAAGAGAESAPSPATQALDGLLPNARMPLELHVSAFGTPGASRATVAVSVSVDAFAPGAAANDREVPLEVVVGAFDPSGRPLASARQTLQLSWPAAGDGEPPRHVDALSRLELAPGDYEIRAAVAGANPADAASVFTHVTVPDYAAVPFSLSHIVFGAGAATGTVPPRFLADVLPVAPTTERAFARAGGATAFVQIYQGTRRTDALQPAGVRVRIVDAQDTVVRDQVLVLQPESFATNRTADLRLALPVQNLLPGQYLLSLEAVMGERTVGRAARFEVR